MVDLDEEMLLWAIHRRKTVIVAWYREHADKLYRKVTHRLSLLIELQSST